MGGTGIRPCARLPGEDGASGDLEGIDRDKVKEVATVNLEECPNTFWPCAGFFEVRAFDRWCQNLLSFFCPSTFFCLRASWLPSCREAKTLRPGPFFFLVSFPPIATSAP